jgi:transcriptional regulator with XRE-family HTH domain
MSNIFYIMPTRAWMTDLGDQIRGARERKDWSQDQLADKVEMSRASINAYENGRGNPEFRVVAEIAAALEKEFNVLGCTIGPEDVIRRLPPAEQLCFEFGREHTFMAMLTIRPSQKSVTITAEAKLGDKLA